MTSQVRGIQSLEVGGRILASLIETCAPMALKDLSLASGLTPGQCHSYLNSYRQIGLVEQDQQSGQYRLGAFALQLALGRVNSVPILNSVSQAADMLAKELGFMVLMLVWGPRGPTIIQVCEGVNTYTLNIRLGTLFSVTGTASGYVFAAFDSSEKVKRLIDEELFGRRTPLSMGYIQQKTTFEQVVRETKERGYATVSGKPVPEINAISAPVLNEASQLAAVITLVGRVDELPTEPGTEISKKLVTACKALSKNG